MSELGRLSRYYFFPFLFFIKHFLRARKVAGKEFLSTGSFQGERFFPGLALVG